MARRGEAARQPDGYVYVLDDSHLPAWLCATCATVNEVERGGLFGAWLRLTEHLWSAHSRRAVFVRYFDPTYEYAIQAALPFVIPNRTTHP